MEARGLKGTWHRTLPGSWGIPMPRINLIGETTGNMSFMVLELGVGVEVGWLEVKWDMAYNIPRFLENPHDKFNFHRCNDWGVNIFRGLVSAVGVGGRGLIGTWLRTLPGFSRTPMLILSLIDETYGKMIFFWCWSWRVGVGE